MEAKALTADSVKLVRWRSRGGDAVLIGTEYFLRHLVFMTTVSAAPHMATVTVKSSAVKAGWICLLLGFCTFWIFGFGFVFFSVTFILAIVAMCTHQVKQGIILLVSSLASMAFCALIFFAVVLGTVGVAANKLSDDVKREQALHRTPRR